MRQSDDDDGRIQDAVGSTDMLDGWAVKCVSRTKGFLGQRGKVRGRRERRVLQCAQGKGGEGKRVGIAQRPTTQRARRSGFVHFARSFVRGFMSA